MRVAIIGGGIIGLGTAWQLAKSGAEAVVFDHGELGASASRAAAGMISPLGEAAFESASESWPDATRDAFLDRTLASRDLWLSWWEELTTATGLPIEYDCSGIVFLAYDDAQATVLERLTQLATERGEALVRPGASDLLEGIPDLGSNLPERLIGAIHLSGEHRVHNIQVCAALVRAAELAGADLRPHTSVEAVDVSTYRTRVRTADGADAFDAVVVAGGAWSGSIRGLPELPVRPVRGQMIRLDGVRWPWQGALRVPGPFYAVRREATGLLLGATVEEAGFDNRNTDRGLRELAEHAARYLPGIANPLRAHAWSGLRPATSDHLPLIGRLEDRALFYATGHHRNGILLTPWTAEHIADWVLGAESEPANHPFSPNRVEARTARSAAS